MDRFEAVIKSGDRVEWKKLIAEASNSDVYFAWIKASSRRVQDFSELAYAEMKRRKMIHEFV